MWCPVRYSVLMASNLLLHQTTQVWQVGDIEEMLMINCDWVRHYLQTKPEDDEDRYLCDGVGE